MGYRILGFLVWKGARAYLRWRVGALLSRRGVAAGVVALGIGAAAVAGARRAGS